jgi:hypothetical protein
MHSLTPGADRRLLASKSEQTFNQVGPKSPADPNQDLHRMGQAAEMAGSDSLLIEA